MKLRGRNGTNIYTDEILIDLFSPKGGISQAQKEAPVDEQVPVIPQEKICTASVLEDVAPKVDEEQEIKETSGTDSKVAIISYPSWASHSFIIGMAVAAMALFANVFRPAYGVDWTGLVAFMLMVILTEWYSIDIYVRNESVSTSVVPMLAGILLFGPIGALVLSFAFATVAMIKHHNPPSRFIFNFSNQMIAGLIYTSILILAGVNFQELHPSFQIMISLGAVGVVYVTTTVFMAVAMGFDRGHPIRGIWREHFGWLSPYYFGMGLIAYLLIFSFQVAGPVGMLIFLVPLLLLRFSQKQFIDRTKAYVKELKVKNLKLETSAGEIQKLNEGLLNTLADVVDWRDPYVLGHSKQVSHYAELIAQKLDLPQKRIELIRNAGLLHDIGKLGISEKILFKPGKLTIEEYNVIKEHATLGADILQASYALEELVPIIRYHHERYDGLGYPDGLQGDEIPLDARILCVADSVEAMASDRPYRRGLNHSEVIEELEKCSGTQFDPLVVKALIDILQSGTEPVVVNSARSLEEREDQLVQVFLQTTSASD